MPEHINLVEMDIRTIQNCLDVEPPLEQEEHLSAQQLEMEGSMGTILSSLFARSMGMNLDMSFQSPLCLFTLLCGLGDECRVWVCAEAGATPIHKQWCQVNTMNQKFPKMTKYIYILIF